MNHKKNILGLERDEKTSLGRVFGVKSNFNYGLGQARVHVKLPENTCITGEVIHRHKGFEMCPLQQSDKRRQDNI